MFGRRVAAAAVLAVAAPLVVAVPATPSVAAAGTYVTNPDFRVDTAGWRAGPGDRLGRFRYENGATSGQLRNASRRAKRQYISMVSSASPTAVPTPGTAATLTARLRTSAATRTVVLRLQEVKDGRIVQQRQTTVKARSTAWFNASRTLVTTTPGSRLRVYAGVRSMSGSQFLRMRQVKVTTVAPPAPPAPPVPPDPPAPPTVPDPPVPPSLPIPAATCEQIDYSDPAQGVRTFTEDFDGTALDPALWRVRDDTFLNQDAAFIDRDNVSVHDGYLDIAGRREPESRWRSNAKSLYGEENRVRRYSTGYVDSIKSKTYESPDAASAQRFSQRYGHFEARMWVPSAATMSQGVWPAFWLRGDRTNGEIDVMESYGSPTIRNFDPSPSYEWNSWHDTAQQMSKQHFLGRPKVSEPIWKGWHTYGVNWSPTCLRYTLDGRTVGIARPIPGEVPYLNGDTFDSPFHLRFNMQVGSKYWGWPDPSVTADEFHFKVDWVRVHQSR